MSALSTWKRRLESRKKLLAKAKKAAHEAAKRVTRRRKLVAQARRGVKRHRKAPLRERAYQAAKSQVGVMESGANNAGVPYSRYQKSNGAVGYEPWCGDFIAWCYRKAGSKRVQRLWAAVRYLRGLVGIRVTHNPLRGDIVTFTFDHVGMFVAWCDASGRTTSTALATHIRTIEGNTGASGAVSDSKTGGDGVYEKVRARSLVADFLRVTG